MATSHNRLKRIIVGKSLQAKRENLSLSRSDLADATDVLPQFVANWERGQCLPPTKAIPVLMNIFNMSAKDFVNLYTMATKVGLEDYFKELEEEAFHG